MKTILDFIGRNLTWLGLWVMLRKEKNRKAVLKMALIKIYPLALPEIERKDNRHLFLVYIGRKVTFFFDERSR